MKIQLIALLIVVGLILNTFSVFGSMNSQNDELEIGEVSGGIARVKVQILNNGDTDIQGLEMTITLGAPWMLFGGGTTTTFDIASGSEETITTGFFLGFGFLFFHFRKSPRFQR